MISLPESQKYSDVNPQFKNRILLIGGVHGNETEGVAFMEGFIREFEFSGWEKLPFNFYLIPVLNPDGFELYKRQNDNAVDLNRNLPTKDWTVEFQEQKYFPGKSAGSEPENQILLNVLSDFIPQYIISFHSWKPMININGPAHKFGEIISASTGMILEEDIGYPTPGSLGTYTGWERKIPTITLEFKRGMALNKVYSFGREGILNSFQDVEN